MPSSESNIFASDGRFVLDGIVQTVALLDTEASSHEYSSRPESQPTSSHNTDNSQNVSTNGMSNKLCHKSRIIINV